METPLLDILEERVRGALEQLVGAPRDTTLPAGLEPGLETLYASTAESPSAVRDLFARLDVGALCQPAIAAWFALADVAAAAEDSRARTLAVLETTVRAAPPWTRLLVTAEGARLEWSFSGAEAAWGRVDALGGTAALREVGPLSSIKRDGPLLVSGVCALLGLAAANGDWGARDEIETLALAWWTTAGAPTVRILLAAAEADLARGEYVRALQRLAPLRARAAGDLRAHLLSTELHALVALGSGADTTTCQVLLEFRRVRRERAQPGDRLAPGELRRIDGRVAHLVACTPALADADLGGPDPAAVTATDRADSPNLTQSLSGLLERERAARRWKAADKRVRALLAVVRQAEVLLRSGDSAIADPADGVRLGLLWCRLVVDLGQHEAFDACDRVLEDLTAESRRLGLGPLEMLAWDQRAVLRSRRNPPDWKGAVVASDAAARLAADLLAANTPSPDSAGRGYERSLLERLLPVLDRVIELHAEGALRVGEKHPGLLSESLGPFDSRLLDQDSPRGAWLRFGRVLHQYAEREQTLALNEARLARTERRATAAERTVVSKEPGTAVIDDLRSDLQPRDGVVQYLLVGRYVLVFAYGRDFFDWTIAQMEGIDAMAERELDDLVERLRPWIQGQSQSVHQPDVRLLETWLLPEKILAGLRQASVRHLRIVPHGALYRVPFSRLAPNGQPLIRLFTLSLHPTGRLAAASAGTRARATARPVSLGHVVGPADPGGAGGAAVEGAVEEVRALRAAVGAFASIASICTVDAARATLAQIRQRLTEFAMLHFTCHGRAGTPLGPPPSMMLGTDPEAGLDSHSIAKLRLDGCALVVLQSCWTGWMDHKRTNPVQGIPQAFCDAGVRACIAPLTSVPAALAATFTDVFYRALRFLPAEAALARALQTVRTHGQALVAGSARVQEELNRHGSSLDLFEYRYTGTTGVAFGGTFASTVGRLAYWWFERRLTWARRRTARPRRTEDHSGG